MLKRFGIEKDYQVATRCAKSRHVRSRLGRYLLAIKSHDSTVFKLYMTSGHFQYSLTDNNSYSSSTSKVILEALEMALATHLWLRDSRCRCANGVTGLMGSIWFALFEITLKLLDRPSQMSTCTPTNLLLLFPSTLSFNMYRPCQQHYAKRTSSSSSLSTKVEDSLAHISKDLRENSFRLCATHHAIHSR